MYVDQPTQSESFPWTFTTNQNITSRIKNLEWHTNPLCINSQKGLQTMTLEIFNMGWLKTDQKAQNSKTLYREKKHEQR